MAHMPWTTSAVRLTLSRCLHHLNQSTSSTTQASAPPTADISITSVDAFTAQQAATTTADFWPGHLCTVKCVLCVAENACAWNQQRDMCVGLDRSDTSGAFVFSDSADCIEWFKKDWFWGIIAALLGVRSLGVSIGAFILRKYIDEERKGAGENSHARRLGRRAREQRHRLRGVASVSDDEFNGSTYTQREWWRRVRSFCTVCSN